MAPIDLKLGQNAFQVIPELSLFDVEDRNNFRFFGLDHFVLARSHVSWLGHMCPGQDAVIKIKKSQSFSVFDVKK